MCRWVGDQPANHRPNTVAAIGHKAPRPMKAPGFWSNFKSHPRELSFVIFAGWGGLGWGTKTAVSGGAGAVTRLVGAATAAG